MVKNEHPNKEIMQFLRCGKELVLKGAQIRFAYSSIVVSFVFQLCTKIKLEWIILLGPSCISTQFIDVRQKGRQKRLNKKRKMFLIIFLCRRLYLGAKSLPVCDVEVIIGLYLIFITSRRGNSVHKLVINNLLFSIAIVSRDLWISLLHLEWK